MSELKVYRDPKDGLAYREFYEKSEADKVISEKDAEIAELKAQKSQAEDDCAYWKMNHGNAANAMHETEEYAMQLYKEAQHNKHKRCLAMARWCERKRIDAATFRIPREKWDFYDKWYKRWLELAEEPTWAKFLQLIHKEAK